MPKVRNDFLFIKTNMEKRRIQNELYIEQRKYLKTHTIAETMETTLEKMKYENKKNEERNKQIKTI